MGAKLIPNSMIEQILQLLADGVSGREIAKQVGVSRGSISLIATGKRGLRREPERPPALATSKHPEWCEPCRAWVSVPCVACAARAAVRRYSVRHDDEELDLDLDLQPEHLARWTRSDH